MLRIIKPFFVLLLYFFLVATVPVNAALLTFEAGVIDNFALPIDPAFPDPQILALKGNPAYLNFDQRPGINGNPDTDVMHGGTFTGKLGHHRDSRI